MSTAAETGATFKVVAGGGRTAYTGKIGGLVGTWANSKKLTYQVYALDFSVPAGRSYSISVSGPISAQSPAFAVDVPDVLYPGLLVNTLFFYQTQRDGPDFIPNALRTAPGHLKDENAVLTVTPPLDDNDFINNLPPAKPLSPANLPDIAADGGWWDAGDYEKYVETVSYTTALMEIGVRDFPNQMGPNAPHNPPAPPNSISYAGQSGAGSPLSSDFSAEANFGLQWLLKMWNGGSQTLAYQVDNSQDWNYYGEGDPASSAGNCGGTYNTPYCLITSTDIWTLSPGRRQLSTSRGSETLRSADYLLYLQASCVCCAAASRFPQPESCRPVGRRLCRLLSTQPYAECRLCQPLSQKCRTGFRTGKHKLRRPGALGRLGIVPHLLAYCRALRWLSGDSLGR